ncbi:TIGR04063 family PEP-CTERM/XrtA system glycosyltransferase [Thalassotalea maritima]|uniref:TIGR04063 family PEP-CTERM/XrtA system glycosyltransferase n=1 Tax=Thalassotalea maritima TaxID=3242416 RepID=UPI0035291653
MKVLHVFDHSIPLQSGYTFRSRAIIKYQQQLGIETCHVTGLKQGPSTKDSEVTDGIRFYRVHKFYHLLTKIPVVRDLHVVWTLYKKLIKVINREQPDILHAHSPALNGLATWLAAKKYNLPFVYEIRAFWEDAAVNHGTCKAGGLRYKLTRALETFVVKRADMVSTICHGLKQDLVARGISADKFFVIPNAVDIDKFKPQTSKDLTLLQQLELQECHVIGFIGSFYEYEGIDMAIRAMSKLQHHNIKLLLVGGGPQEQKLKNLVAELGLEASVVFTGRVDHELVQRYYSLIDLLVFPRKRERLTELVTPLKPLEAFAQGKPFLASDVGGHKELLDSSMQQMLFRADSEQDLIDKVIAFANAPQSLYQLVSDKAGTICDTRNWVRSVEIYLPFYQRLLGE